MDKSKKDFSPISPVIEKFSWGSVQVNDYSPFKDAKLYPGGAREWDWKETGTSHDPGIQVSDVLELIERGAQHIVLSKGVLRRLKTCDSTLTYLQEQNINYDILQSEKAVHRYNELVNENIPVGALIHSTC
jgi:hypothetical protein